MSLNPFTFDPVFIRRIIDGSKTQSRRLEKKFEIGDDFYPFNTNEAFSALYAHGSFETPVFQIIKVWQEPVRSISVQDVKAEGLWCAETGCDGPQTNECLCRQPQERFRMVIERIYPGIWKRNDLVWVHEWSPSC